MHFCLKWALKCVGNDKCAVFHVFILKKCTNFVAIFCYDERFLMIYIKEIILRICLS